MSFITIQSRQRRLNSQNKVMISQRAVDYNLWAVETDNSLTWLDRLARAIAWGAVIAFFLVALIFN